ncbi:sulfate/molybdate ABC transporter ATP-binding protein [candidate division KSB1 bacterium]|nr:sulfate/molybdate ABC transporter ATP-binding protein [candidate division KSB1 bacterium]
MRIDVQNLTKKFGAFTALRNIHLEVSSGELLALLGPSGCGKTTLLRILAGLEFPDSGSIRFDGEEAINQNVRARKVGFVFQHYALFRHMNVFENIAFGLRVRPHQTRPSREEINTKVQTLLKLVKLEDMATRYPSLLSGGQRQRVALARALAVEPRVLLLDEPFGALDAKVRQELRRWLRRLHDEIHITSVFVTHDQEEALEVADRVVVMNAGQIEQIGAPEEVYNHPATPFVYNFLGNVNLFRGRIEDDKIYVGGMAMELPAGTKQDTESATIYVRPHLLDIEPHPRHQNHFRARIKHINAAGPQVKIELTTEWGDPVHVEISQERYRILGLRRELEVFVTPKEKNVPAHGT